MHDITCQHIFACVAILRRYRLFRAGRELAAIEQPSNFSATAVSRISDIASGRDGGLDDDNDHFDLFEDNIVVGTSQYYGYCFWAAKRDGSASGCLGSDS